MRWRSHVLRTNQSWPAISDHVHQHAADRIGDVVMRAGTVINTVSTAASRTPFKTAKLTSQTRQIEQTNPLAIQCREELTIDLALVPRRHVVGDDVNSKL